MAAPSAPVASPRSPSDQLIHTFGPGPRSGAVRHFSGRTGEGREFRGFDTTGAVVDVAWQGDRALGVVSTHTGGQTLHTLYSCAVATLACEYHYEDETGTLRLPAS